MTYYIRLIIIAGVQTELLMMIDEFNLHNVMRKLCSEPQVRKYN